MLSLYVPLYDKINMKQTVRTNPNTTNKNKKKSTGKIEAKLRLYIYSDL